MISIFCTPDPLCPSPFCRFLFPIYIISLPHFLCCCFCFVCMPQIILPFSEDNYISCLNIKLNKLNMQFSLITLLGLSLVSKSLQSLGYSSTVQQYNWVNQSAFATHLLSLCLCHSSLCLEIRGGI